MKNFCSGLCMRAIHGELRALVGIVVKRICITMQQHGCRKQHACRTSGQGIDASPAQKRSGTAKGLFDEAPRQSGECDGDCQKYHARRRRKRIEGVVLGENQERPMHQVQ